MAPAEAVIARIAARQQGLVTRSALLGEGVSGKAIRHRLEAGRLRRVFPGVYTASLAPLTSEQTWLAAVLACGPGSGLAAGFPAATWRMLSEPPGPVEVLRCGPNREGPAGVRLRHTRRLELITHRRIPVTTPARTLLHLGVAGPLGRLELALSEAQALRLVSRAELEALATSGRRGSPAIRRLLEDAPGYTREGAERHLRAVVLRAELPRAQHNAMVLGHERDAYWPEHGLVVEVDGWATHGSREAFERDRARDAQLTAAGLRPMRITWRQLTQAPESVAARLGAALARAPA